MKKSLTLLDLIIALVVGAILVTLAVPAYRNVAANAEAKVCQTNLKVILGVVEARALEEDRLPGSLGELEKQDFQKAWAKVFKEQGTWKLKLAYFISDFNKRGLVYAQEAWIERYAGDTRYLSCPADDDPYPEGISYGLNSGLIDSASGQGISLDDYRQLLGLILVVGDCDAATFDSAKNLEQRHVVYRFLQPPDYYALAIEDDEEIQEVGRENSDFIPDLVNPDDLIHDLTDSTGSCKSGCARIMSSDCFDECKDDWRELGFSSVGKCKANLCVGCMQSCQANCGSGVDADDAWPDSCPD